jgi:predicted amidohydrolase
MADSGIFRVAAIQASPVFLNRDASLEKAVSLIKQAAKKGACVAAFGEAWLPGYPIHAEASSTSPLWWELASAHLEQSIEILGPATDALCAIAGEAGIDVVIGVSERDTNTRGSAYSTLLFIGREGQILGRHRKLKPAPHERTVWADGDAVDLRVHDRAYGCLSGLTSTEHQMVLPTYALAEHGSQVHVATWPGGEPEGPNRLAGKFARQHLLSRAFAAQTGAYVICAGTTLTTGDIPEKYRHYLSRECAGHSAIIDPFGEIIAGPAEGETILTADCSLAAVRSAKIAFDCAGHSGRPDQLKLWSQMGSEQDGGMLPEFHESWSSHGPDDQFQPGYGNPPPPRTAKSSGR